MPLEVSLSLSSKLIVHLSTRGRRSGRMIARMIPDPSYQRVDTLDIGGSVASDLDLGLSP